MLSTNFKELTRSFPFFKHEIIDIPHTYVFITCSPCIYLTSYTFIPSLCIHEWWLGIHGWVRFHFFFPLFLAHDNGNIVNPSICTHCIIGVRYCASVQGFYIKCTKYMCLPYKGVQDKPCWRILKNFNELTHSFPL